VDAKVHDQVAGLLGDPGAGGVGADPDEVHTAAVLDHHQNVEAAQEDRVGVDEVDGEHRVGLCCYRNCGQVGPERGRCRRR